MQTVIVDPAVQPGFAEVVQRQERVWFEEILPRYLDTAYRGRGIELVSTLVRDLDAGALLARIDGPRPSARARQRAQAIRATCPVAVDSQIGPLGQGEDADGFPVFVRFEAFGQFTHRWTSTFYTPTSSTVAEEHRAVVLFEGAYASVADLDHVVLETIVHEYVHFFESFLPPRRRTLMLREAGYPDLQPPDSVTARRGDTLYLLWWWLRGPVVLVVIAGVVAALFVVIGAI